MTILSLTNNQRRQFFYLYLIVSFSDSRDSTPMNDCPEPNQNRYYCPMAFCIVTLFGTPLGLPRWSWSQLNIIHVAYFSPHYGYLKYPKYHRFLVSFADVLFHRCNHDTSSCPNRFCGSYVNPLNRVSCNRFAIVERILVVIPAETIG